MWLNVTTLKMSLLFISIIFVHLAHDLGWINCYYLRWYPKQISQIILKSSILTLEDLLTLEYDWRLWTVRFETVCSGISLFSWKTQKFAQETWDNPSSSGLILPFFWNCHKLSWKLSSKSYFEEGIKYYFFPYPVLHCTYQKGITRLQLLSMDLICRFSFELRIWLELKILNCIFFLLLKKKHFFLSMNGRLHYKYGIYWFLHSHVGDC